MSKSRIGPFALEAPLSKSRTAGQLFRGIHLEQKKLAAIRVFPIPMGLTPESRRAYAEQLEELKQFRHDSIVRCYGGGFDSRSAYLAYELVDGESLDRILERRDQLPWETAFDFSQQITAALQFAHEAEWIHGRLKPDKVLVTRDSVVKLADWRREEISSMLGGNRLTRRQMMFAAPEILQGQEPNQKTDLYSIGAIMYTMLTGHPPFSADRPEELQNLVETAIPPDVGVTVFDSPVWLNAIVAQLLSKDPAQRPYSAVALQLAFKEALKRQSQGVGVLQHATAGFSPLNLKTDRDEAEKVLGIKPKKKRKKKRDESESLLEQTWVLILGLVGAVAGIVWFMLPLSEAALRTRAEALLPPETQRWQDWNKARDQFLTEISERFPGGEHSQWASEQVNWINAREKMRHLQRDSRLNRTDDWGDADRQFWAAWEYEQFGDTKTASQKYEALITIYGDREDASEVCYLANENLERIAEEGIESELETYLNSKLAEADAAYDAARIMEARAIWESIVELYGEREDVQAQYEQAENRLEESRTRR